MADIKKEVAEVYRQTDAAIGALVENLSVKNDGCEEELKQSVGKILGEMDDKHAEFRKRISDLERDSEFEKFTIAFFWTDECREEYDH